MKIVLRIVALLAVIWSLVRYFQMPDSSLYECCMPVILVFSIAGFFRYAFMPLFLAAYTESMKASMQRHPPAPRASDEPVYHERTPPPFAVKPKSNTDQ